MGNPNSQPKTLKENSGDRLASQGVPQFQKKCKKCGQDKKLDDFPTFYKHNQNWIIPGSGWEVFGVCDKGICIACRKEEYRKRRRIHDRNRDRKHPEKRKTEKYRMACRKRRKKQCYEMSDTFVKKMLNIKYKIPAKYITTEIIKVQREKIIADRILNKFYKRKEVIV